MDKSDVVKKKENLVEEKFYTCPYPAYVRSPH